MTRDVAALMQGYIEGRAGMPEDDACALFAAMLDGRVPAAQRRRVLAEFDSERRPVGETIGFLCALEAHVRRLRAPADRSRPVVLAVGAGTRTQPNLAPLVALLLARYGVPVLMHGASGGEIAQVSRHRARNVAGGAIARPKTDPASGAVVASGSDRTGRTAAVTVLRALGILPATNLADAQARLLRHGIAYLPTAVLAPGLAPLLADARRASGRSLLRLLVALIDPFGGDSYRVVGVARQKDLPRTREILAATGADALLLRGTEGEPFANPNRQPQLEHFVGGRGSVCEQANTAAAPGGAALTAMGAAATAAWVARALVGEEPLPASILAQLGCCLSGARRTPVATGNTANPSFVDP